MKRIVSIWLPAWPIERMARTGDSALRDLLAASAFALVVAERGVLRIHAANARARAGGVRAGQALADARAVLPSLKTCPAEPSRDAAGLLALARWAGRYGPQRHADGADGLWIDATGVAHLYGGETRLVGDLYARLSRFGLTARIALAGTVGGAHALSRFATSSAQPVHCVAAGRQALADALAPLPVAALRLDPDQIVLARRLGLKRIGQLYGVPRASLARRFRCDALAAALLARLDGALGELPEPRAGLAEPPQRSVLRSFAEPLISADGLAHAVADLADEIAAVMQAQGVGLRRGRLRLSRSDGSALEIVVGTAAPVSAARHLMDLLAGKLETVDAGFGIDAVHLDALAVEPLAVQQTALRAAPCAVRRAGAAREMAAFADPGAHDAALARLADRLANRLGSARVFTLSPAPRHMPEHAETARPVLALRQPGPAGEGAGTSASRGAGNCGATADPAFAGGHHRAPRPVLLLARPEPIAVLAEVPDGPPLRFTWRRVEHRVVAAEGPERIAPAWWRALPLASRGDSADRAHAHTADDDPAALGERVVRSSLPRTRDYYRIEDHEGGCYWVFRDGLYGREDDDDGSADGTEPGWFMHGVFA
jgi:protein ImuB